MKDNIFFDTNILVYAHTDVDIYKQQISQKLISESQSVISTQVLQELSNTLRRKFKQQWDSITNIIESAVLNNKIHNNDSQTILLGCEIANRYNYSFYDSMIISAAISSNCAILFSEDLQDGQMIYDKLKIMNPFKQ
jgi:predicted nucleic acid-binding protein